jgi:hypothetical protein
MAMLGDSVKPHAKGNDMKKVPHVNGWENFEVAHQDQAGKIVTDGGLYTANLLNCMCLVVTNGVQYGMIHVSPMHEKTAEWAKSLLDNVQPTEAMITGANGKTQNSERSAQLEEIFKGRNIKMIDATKEGWVPQTLKPDRVDPGHYVGFVAVDAATGNYALSSLYDFQSSTGIQPPRRQGQGRGTADGGCTIF